MPLSPTQDGTTSLFLACQSGHAAVASALIRECANRARDVHIFVGAPRRSDGAAPLFIAAQMGNAECVKALLQAGAEVDQARIVSWDKMPIYYMTNANSRY